MGEKVNILTFMTVTVTLVVGSDGSTTKNGSSAGVTTAADRSEFLARRRTADRRDRRRLVKCRGGCRQWRLRRCRCDGDHGNLERAPAQPGSLGRGVGSGPHGVD